MPLRRTQSLLRQWMHRRGAAREWALITCGALVGLLTALGAVAFTKGLHTLEDWCRATQSGLPNWALPAIPILGALATGLLVHLLASAAKGHGVPQVLEAIHKRGGRIPARVGLVKALASIATVGTGGSAGAEGPIVQIGSTIGSTVARGLRVSPEHVTTLLGCGAAAGIASVFNAPIAGVLFVLEVLLRDFTLRTFTPVVVASVISTATTQGILSRNEALFEVGQGGYQFTITDVPVYVLLGVVCAGVGVAFTRLMHLGERLFDSTRLHPVVRPVSGAILLGALGVGFAYATSTRGFPPFFGAGYDAIRVMIEPATYADDHPIIHGVAPDSLLLAGLVVCKALATMFTLGSGGSGGVFAPSLFLGAAAGASTGVVLRSFGLMGPGDPATAALVGMAAVVAGTTFAPLTAILLVFEITREPLVLLPVMLTAVVTTSLSRAAMRDSIYTMKLRHAGVLLGTAGDLSILRRVPLLSVELTPLPEPVYASDPMGKLIAMHATHHVPDFVVVDHQGAYLGMVTGADMRTALVDREAIPLLLVAELLRVDLPTLSAEENLDTVMEKFARQDVASLCLLGPDGRTPQAMVTRGALLRRYQAAMAES